MDSKRREYLVETIEYGYRHGYTVILVPKEEPTVKAKISLKNYLALKGIKPEVPTASGFVTRYAQTDYAENFAEMVTHYCLGKLAADQVTALEAILTNV